MRVAMVMFLGSAFTVGCKLLGLVAFGWFVVLSPIWGLTALVFVAAMLHVAASSSADRPDSSVVPAAPVDLEPD